MAIKPIMVSQLNEYIATTLKHDPLLNNVTVRGEVTSLKIQRSGHVYFNISDEKSTLRCMIWSSNELARKDIMQVGDEVILVGQVSVYVQGGSYALTVKHIDVVGAGDISGNFNLLKRKLEKKGFFDASHKKTLPKFPKHIGIITSDSGAAITDIKKIIQSRTKMTDITIFPVKVQGAYAADSMVRVLEHIEHEYQNDIDLIILGRGGGAPEDLAAFNNERLAESIYRSSIPIISAVGHELDFSISDFVADVRAATPTDAAAIAVEADIDLKEIIDNYYGQINSSAKNIIAYGKLKAGNIYERILVDVESKLSKYKLEVEKYSIILNERSPQTVMQRGYALVHFTDGRHVRSISDLMVNDKIRVSLHDGIAECIVKGFKED